ncbi:MAG: phosphomethylpyrimidine synthase ThiC [Promethearchaeota archaeon]
MDMDQLENLARHEMVDASVIERRIKNGMLVAMGDRSGNILLIGKGTRTKVNVNLGTSNLKSNFELEMEKARVAVKHGADTLSDCSVGSDLDGVRRALLSTFDTPLTTLPVYQVANNGSGFDQVTDESILKIVEKHVTDGVNSIVIHAGFTVDDLNYLKSNRRIMGIVSKGGSMTSAIALSQGRENPFLTLYDDILELLAGNNVVLNLGNAMRSGAIHDFKDRAQYREIVNNAKLAKRANARGIQVIIEGLGGHVNAYNLREWVEEHNRITGDRPLFVAGPLPTEIGVGYDHISAAIGGAMAAGYGADYLCAVTPAEHLSLPDKEQIREGLIAAHIAAHVGDSLKYGITHLFDADKELSQFRAQKKWSEQKDFALDPERVESIHPGNEEECSMCGKHCAISVMRKYLFKD